jgi:hypothetical protein
MVAIHPWQKATPSASSLIAASTTTTEALRCGSRTDGNHRFYRDDHLSRRLSSHTLTREQAIEKATALARTEQDKLDNPE